MNTPPPAPAAFTSRTISFHGQEAVQLQAGDGSEAVILLHGAHLVSWKTAGGVERLYLSDRAVYAPGQAVRGGVPVVFPQFAAMGPLAKHGFARALPWTLKSVDATPTDALVLLQLRSGDATRAAWPFEFALELSLRVSAQRLDMELEAANTGDKPWAFTAALHTYLSVPDIAAVRLHGLSRLRYRDSVTGKEQVDPTQSLQVDDELDRIYYDAARPLVLQSGGGPKDAVAISQTGFTDVVVWNPGPANAAKLADMPDDGWKRMLCVEAALVGEARTLQPGEEWWGRQSIDCAAHAD